MGLDIESNSAWLYPMIESCLPDDILRAWQRCNIRGKEDSDSEASFPKSSLTLLMNFLKREVTGEERLQLARSGFETIIPKERVKEKIRKRDNKYPTAAGLFAAKEMLCLFCGKSHESKDCVVARSFSLEEKIKKVREKNCCLKCLRFGHCAKTCKVFVCCHVCSKPHTEIFCPEIGKTKEISDKSKPLANIQNTLANQQCSKEVALMTLEILIKGNKKIKKVRRALLDSGSQRSYILKSTAKELGLKPLAASAITHTVFGGAEIEAKLYSKYKLN
ncbi:uncharacterized protein LOC118199357 [Stegodyphus dumicola]|uniref:uncharacterized protein LOC118199357 n=1 Tax=Stegodyphus dumicola TaxID=202533 RepID=UPI0015A7CDFB|nr:uncharacterized protein LOC118199357 [Stegodyphus dumicola]